MKQTAHAKHTLLESSGGMNPKKYLVDSCPEIECGGFWQLADYLTLVTENWNTLSLVY